MFKRAAIILTALAVSVGSASATTYLYLEDETTSTSMWITDGGGGDLNPVAGSVTFVGSLGLWSINVSTAQGYPALGSIPLPVIDLNSVNTSSAAASLLVVMVDTDHSTGSDPLNYDFQIGGTTDPNGALTLAAFCTGTGSNNTADLGCDSFFYEDLSPFSGSFSDSATGGMTGLGDGTPFALKMGFRFIHEEAGVSSINQYLATTPGGGDTNVPEPTTMLLFSTALLGLGFMRRKKS